MRVGFYSTVGNFWCFGEVATTMPLCVQCGAFHYSNVKCITNEKKRDLVLVVKRNLLDMRSKGFLTVEHLFREALGLRVVGMGLLHDFGVGRNEDLLEVLKDNE